MKNILFPTEFSAHAGQVFLYALEIAKRNNAMLTLMHAYQVPTNPELTMEDLSNEAIQSLEEFVDFHTPKEYESVSVKCMAEMGFPADAILKVSKEKKMDFIVMGMKGKTNALEAYFGSVAMDVTNKTNLPVFLVPSTNRFKSIKQVVYGFDQHMSDLVGIAQINKIIGKLNANITCVHFNEDKSNYNQVQATTNFLKDLFNNHPTYKTISFTSLNGEFEDGIQDYIVENNTDLLITQTHKRNWKFRFIEPGDSNKIARKINIPMLILKEERGMLVAEKMG